MYKTLTLFIFINKNKNNKVCTNTFGKR